MSASLAPVEPFTQLPIAAPSRSVRSVAATSPELAPWEQQVGTVREMLSTLDMFTAAGQRYIMDKVAAFVGRYVAANVRRLGAHRGNALAMTDLATTLALDAERTSPDVQAFRDHTESVLALLARAR